MARRCGCWRAAGGDHHLPARGLAAPGAAGALRAARRGAGGAASRPAAIYRRRAPMRWARRAGRRCSTAAGSAADAVQPGLAAELDCDAGGDPGGLAARTCRSGRSMPTCSPTTCSSSEGGVVRADRLLFRCDRPAGLRHRGLPERLVLRAGRVLQRHPGACAAGGLAAAPAAVGGGAAALPVLCRGAAIRFLLTRLYDWMATPPGALVTPQGPDGIPRRAALPLRRRGTSGAYGL